MSKTKQTVKDRPAQPEFDAHGYPTDRTVKLLSKWPMEDASAALDFLKAAWHWPALADHELTAHEGYVVHEEPGDKFLRLATGGWSGNENLVRAFRESLAWGMTWRLSTRGGLHIFQYPEVPA